MGCRYSVENPPKRQSHLSLPCAPECIPLLKSGNLLLLSLRLPGEVITRST